MKINSNRIAREEVLSELYVAFSKGEHVTAIHHFCSQLEKRENEVRELLVDLHKDGFTVAVANDSYEILPRGVLYTERNRLAPEGMVLENKAVRARILDELANLQEASGLSQSMHVQAIADAIGKNVNVVLNNVDVLNDLGLIVPYLMNDLRITESGLLDVKNRKSPPQTH